MEGPEAEKKAKHALREKRKARRSKREKETEGGKRARPRPRRDPAE